MQSVQDFNGLLLFALYFATSVAMLGAFTWLYLRVTPYDEAAEISKGNLAPAVALAGAMLGFTFPLLVASYTHSSDLSPGASLPVARSCSHSGSCIGCCHA